MSYYGVDFHKLYSFIAEVDEKGKTIKEQTIRNSRESLEVFAKSLEPGSKLAVEAVGNWYYFHELLEEMPVEVNLSHPKKTKAIASAKVKTDKIDAGVLANLLRMDYLPLAYIPPKEIRDLREVVRFRAGLVGLRTLVKNRVRAILLKNGVLIKSVFSQAGRKQVLNLCLRECFNEELEAYYRVIDHLEEEITRVSKKIQVLALNTQEVRLLMTMPGIGYYTALLLYAEIGEIERFERAGQLCSYAGLVPSVHSSGGRTRYGRITKEGSRWIRWALVEVAHHIARGSVRFAALYERVEKKHGKSAAKIAVAREAIRVIFRMLKDKEPFRGSIKEKTIPPAISLGT